MSTPEQRAFLAIHEQGDLASGVQLARRVVASLFLSNTGELTDPLGLAEELAGESRREGPESVTWDSHCAQVYAAMVLGIALGQLVHPDVFTPERAR